MSRQPSRCSEAKRQLFQSGGDYFRSCLRQNRNNLPCSTTSEVDATCASYRNPGFLPWWLWAIVAIEITVPTFFGVASIMDPGMWGADVLGPLGQLYVTRNFTMVLAILVAVTLRSRAALARCDHRPLRDGFCRHCGDLRARC